MEDLVLLGHQVEVGYSGRRDQFEDHEHVGSQPDSGGVEREVGLEMIV